MTMRRVHFRFAAPVFCLLLSSALAQTVAVERYELGLRLRTYERRLGECQVPALRRASLRELDRAVQAFFRLDTRGVAAAVEAADLALDVAPPAAGRRFARSLQLVLEARLVATTAASLPFRVSSAFACDGPLPGHLRLTIRIGERCVLPATPIAELPFSGSLHGEQLPIGDSRLEWSLYDGADLLMVRAQAVSVVTDRDSRLDRLHAIVTTAEPPAPSIESATLVGLERTLRVMTRRRGEETVLPGAQLLAEAEALAVAIDAHKGFYGPERVGEHWLRVPAGTRTVALRMYSPSPSSEASKAKRPLVLALHGAGGSENLFFDGYGDGAIVRLCEQKAYYLVAPRSDGFSGVDLAELLDALAKRWPIDPDRVAVIGHSMGAAQAVANAMRTPRRFAAIAALGGGGDVVPSPELEALPFFLGVGEHDFARASVMTLHRQLDAAGVPCTFRQYDDVEHLAIVQTALPDVFAFFATRFAKQ